LAVKQKNVNGQPENGKNGWSLSDGLKGLAIVPPWEHRAKARPPDENLRFADSSMNSRPHHQKHSPALRGAKSTSRRLFGYSPLAKVSKTRMSGRAAIPSQQRAAGDDNFGDRRCGLGARG